MQTILIVDDSPTIRRMVRASLTGVVDAQLLEAGSGLQAIESLALQPVHAMILDLNMPDMHGVDVLRFVRSHTRYRSIPVLVLTTRGDATSRDTVMQAGASAYMTKPFAPAALALAVKEILGVVAVSVAPDPRHQG